MEIINVLILMIQCFIKICYIVLTAGVSGIIALLILQVTMFWTCKISLYNLAIKEAKKFTKKYKIF